MNNKCIITGQETKSRLKYNKQNTKIPLSKEGKNVINLAIPHIQEQVTKELKEYVRLHAKEYNLEEEFVDQAHTYLFGNNFNNEGIRYMVYNIINGKVKEGIMYTIVKKAIKQHLNGLLEKLDG